jgi:hypothetical protein
VSRDVDSTEANDQIAGPRPLTGPVDRWLATRRAAPGRHSRRRNRCADLAVVRLKRDVEADSREAGSAVDDRSSEDVRRVSTAGHDHP